MCHADLHSPSDRNPDSISKLHFIDQLSMLSQQCDFIGGNVSYPYLEETSTGWEMKVKLHNKSFFDCIIISVRYVHCENVFIVFFLYNARTNEINNDMVLFLSIRNTIK
mmetsp:Transcript_17628/g.43031  ORF Transcript_17628/g.43031 Transcript_17628/m.43031 type:complete len:109 (+) Transcript_17628:906-1232(+)